MLQGSSLGASGPNFQLTFCFATRIIEPLASRCSKFRFKSLDPSSTQARIQMIAEAENVQMDQEVGGFCSTFRALTLLTEKRS